MITRDYIEKIPDNKFPLRIQEIHKSVTKMTDKKITYDNVLHALARLMELGRLKRVGFGVYDRVGHGK